MFRLLGSCIAVAAIASSGCFDCKKGGNELLCGAEGTPAPEPSPILPSACQPRAVMPQFFALIDNNDPALAGLRLAVGDLGTPRCAGQPSHVCKTDSDCAAASAGSCSVGNSPIAAVLGITMRAMATIATDTTERNPVTGKLECKTAIEAKDLPDTQRNRMCELRRTLDVLLLQNGGSNLLNDPAVKLVLLTILDYVQGKTDGKTHYDLFTGIGRMAASQTAACDPAAGWALIDNLLKYLTPAVAAAQLGALQTLLADPTTKAFLSSLSQGGGANARDNVILLLHGLTPSLIAAKNGAEALASINNLLNQLVYNGNYPEQFKDEVKAVMTGTAAVLADATGIFPPLQKVISCTASAEVRCPDPSRCTNHDDELVGALYDILSRPENKAGGGLDLSTLVGALKTLISIDSTGQTTRTLRLIVEGIAGSPDPNDPHEARDAVAALTRDALTADEGAKLVPALSILIKNQVLLELFSLLQDVLYTCKPPHT